MAGAVLLGLHGPLYVGTVAEMGFNLFTAMTNHHMKAIGLHATGAV